MRHRALLTGATLIMIVGLLLASVALSSPPVRLHYSANVGLALAWFGSSTPKGSSVLSVTDPAFQSVNLTFPSHQGYYDPWATTSPVTASYAAIVRGAHYLAVTNLQDNGSSYGANFAWRTFNSSSLGGALLAYGNADVHIFCLVTSC